MIQDIATVA